MRIANATGLALSAALALALTGLPGQAAAQMMAVKVMSEKTVT